MWNGRAFSSKLTRRGAVKSTELELDRASGETQAQTAAVYLSNERCKRRIAGADGVVPADGWLGRREQLSRDVPTSCPSREDADTGTWRFQCG